MKNIGRLVVPSMLALAMAVGMTVVANASPDSNYSSSSSYSSNGRQVTTNFTSDNGSSDRGAATGAHQEDDDMAHRGTGTDDSYGSDDGHDDGNDHDGMGAGGGMGGGDDGDGHDGGDDD